MEAVKNECCNIKAVLNETSETEEQDNDESDSNNEFISNGRCIFPISVHIFYGEGCIYQRIYFLRKREHNHNMQNLITNIVKYFFIKKRNGRWKRSLEKKRRGCPNKFLRDARCEIPHIILHQSMHNPDDTIKYGHLF